MNELKYDLGERTSHFGESAIDFCLGLAFTPVTSPLVNQFIRASTSVGANYAEADEAESKADFRHKIALCRKEARETKHWCRMLAKAEPDHTSTIRALWKEAHELHMIFCRILRTTDQNLRISRATKPSAS